MATDQQAVPDQRIGTGVAGREFVIRTDRITRRQRAFHLPAGAVIPVVGGLLALVADAQGLSLITLQGNLISDYGLTTAQAAWTLSATAIATAAAVPLITRMGDRYGLRKMFLISLGLVVLGQILCSVAGSFGPLILGRTIVGFSATTSLIYALIRETSHDEHAVRRTMGIITSLTGGGIALAFLFGGAILRLGGSVSTFFWILTVAAAFAWVLSWLFLPDSAIRSKSRVDWVGGALLGIVLVAVVLAVGQGNDWGWRSGRVIFCAMLAVFGVAAWIVWERRMTAPMIDLKTLARRSVWPAALVAGLTNGLGLYNSLLVSGYVQTPKPFGYGMGASPLMAGVYLLPASIPIAFGGLVSAPLIRRFGARRCMLIGSGVLLCNQLWLGFRHDTAVDISVGLAIFGCSYAVVFTAAMSALMTEARRGESGMLSSISTIASTVGLAIVPAVIVATLTSQLIKVPGINVVIPAENSYVVAFLLGAVLAAVTLLTALVARVGQFSSQVAEDAMSLEIAATTTAAVSGAGASTALDDGHAS